MFNFLKQNKTEEVSDITTEQNAEIKSIAGGQEGYERLMAWSQGTLTSAFIEKFDEVISTGNFEEIKEEVTKLNNRFALAIEGDPEGVEKIIESILHKEEAPFYEAVGKLYLEMKPNPVDMGSTLRALVNAHTGYHEAVIADLKDNPQEGQSLEVWERDLKKLQAAYMLLEEV